MNTIVRAALFATVLPVLVPAQESGPTEKPGTQQGRRHGHPTGEARPAARAVNQDERIRKLLKHHPKLRDALKKKADINGDGKFNAADKKALHRLLKARVADVQAHRKKRGAGAGSRIGPRTGSRTDNPRVSRLDRNGDRKVDRAERKRAQRFKGRVDCNHDGKVGRAARKLAKKVKHHVDKNKDGRVGPVERKRAQLKKHRTDRNHNARVGPAQRRSAKKVRARRKS